MSDKDSDHMLLELQEARAEIDRLRELMRWRDASNEPPTEHGEYLFHYPDFKDGGCTRIVVHWNGSWPLWFAPIANRKSCYWRPIGPLPGGASDEH